MAEKKENPKQKFEHLRELELPEMAEAMATAKTNLEQLKELCKLAQAEFDFLRLDAIPDKMDDMGVSNVTYEGIGRLGLTGDVYARILKENQEEAFDWLIDNEFEELITETVNSSTFKAFVKEQLGKGQVFPEDLFSIKPFSRATITKVKAKKA